MVSVSADSEMRELVWRACHLIELETAMTRMFPFMLLNVGTKSDAKRTIPTRQVRISELAQTSQCDREVYDCRKWEIWAQWDA
jgi:hypothetical protein